MHVLTFAVSMTLAIATFALVATALWGGSWFLLLYVGIALVVLQAGYLALAYLVIGRRRDRPARGDPGAPEPTRDRMAMRTLPGPASGERH
ncbi:hypothetical protein [Aureimonas pseudogalii]|uniref:Exopolysaccharide production repressor exox n=1 Tax=Aureimonas pseudogalii TaxID=1744844 RepID=A0A7W6H337_9HYPH|nr:hypothetical protein [Aureimonas pseudogalii]MBB3997621.1 hypothetical protein [Aureimonas pseudogalii]